MIYNYIFSNKINISKFKFDEIFLKYITQYTKNNFSYDKTILLLKYFYYYSKCIFDESNYDLSKTVNFAKFIENHFNWVKVNSVNFNNLFSKVVEIRLIFLSKNEELDSFGNLFDIIDNYLTSFIRFHNFTNNNINSHLFISEKNIVDLISLQFENDK